MPKLLDMVAPLEPVEFPNGKTFAITPLGPEEWEMLREVQRTSDGALALKFLKRIVPEATDDDLAMIGPAHVAALCTYAAGQIDMALVAIKNSPGGEATAAPPTPPSNP